MPHCQRLFPFEGSDKEYIAYLEGRLSAALNREHSQNDYDSAIVLSRNLATTSSVLNETTSASPCLDAQSRLPATASPNSQLHLSRVTLDSQNCEYRSASSVFQAASPTSIRSSESSESPPSSTPGDFRILYYDPIRKRASKICNVASISSPFEESSIIETQPMKELREFIQDLTVNSCWVTKKAVLGLSRPEINRYTIEALCGRPLASVLGDEPRVYPEHYPSEQKTLILRGCDYGALTKERSMHGDLLLHIAKYQKLIFVSLCAVMLDTGTPITTVDWMMRHYVSDTTAGNLRRLRDGCKWVNRCISKLQDQDWGFKSWETFLLFPRSLEQYGRFAWTKNTYEAFTKDMGAPEQAQPIVDNGFIPYCIPCFIKIVAGNDLKLVDICNSLGYSILVVSPIYENYFNDAPLDFNPFLHAYSEPVVEFNPFTYAYENPVADFVPFDGAFHSATPFPLVQTICDQGGEGGSISNSLIEPGEK